MAAISTWRPQPKKGLGIGGRPCMNLRHLRPERPENQAGTEVASGEIVLLGMLVQEPNASAYPTSHSFVVRIDSGARCAVPPRNRNAVPDTDGQKNHVAACGAPGEWPNVDFGALLQGRRRQDSFHRSFSAKLCKVRRPPNPTKIGVGCFSYA